MDPESKDPVGRRLSGRYLVERRLGTGGMADVFQGRDEWLGRPVALKILRSELQADSALRRRFGSEARSAARLSHPHVVGVYDVGEDGDIVYLVMELLSDETLADRLRISPLSEAQTRQLGLDLLAALAAAHAAGVLHRDVKPANVLFAADGTAKLADFGIAKALEEPEAGEDLTRANMVLGTPAYLAPERTEGAAGTPASDLWAVGVVMYESLTGVKPFARPTALASALAARDGVTEPLDKLRPGLDPTLVAVIDRALQPRPSDRYASAAEMSAALRDPSVPGGGLPGSPVLPGARVPGSPTGDAPTAALALTDLAAAGGAGGAGAATTTWVSSAAAAREGMADDDSAHWLRTTLLVAFILAVLAGAVTGLVVYSTRHNNNPPASTTTSTATTHTTLPRSTTSAPQTTESTSPATSSTSTSSTTTPSTTSPTSTTTSSTTPTSTSSTSSTTTPTSTSTTTSTTGVTVTTPIT